MQNNTITPNEAIVLQQVYEDGEDNATALAYMLGMSRSRIMQLLTTLREKGLIAAENSFDGVWIRATSKGRKLMRYLWPEATSAAV